jgi:nucleoside-diphosphate-sugar epimerase
MVAAPSRTSELIIVTGSSGLIGSAVTDRLRHRYQVVGFDRDGNPEPPPEVENICVDLSSDRSIGRGLARVRYAYGDHIASIVHLAAYYSFDEEESPLYDEVTVRGTERLLRELREGGFHVEQFIFSSTMLVHRPTQPGMPVNEDSPIEPKWAYPKSKVAAEEVVRAEHGDIPFVILRIAGVYTDECDSIPLSNQIDRILRKSLTARVYPGDIRRGQSFVHLDDLVDAIESCIEVRRRVRDEVYLIGEPETLSYDFLQREFAKLLHGDDDWTTREIPKALAKTGAWAQDHLEPLPGIEEPFIKPWMVDLADDHYEFDISRARDRLGWEPRHSLRATLPKMIEALRRDPRAWFQRHKIEPPGDADVLRPRVGLPESGARR